MIIAIIKEMRVYQWVKNTLIFVPLLLSHTYTDLDVVSVSLIAFIAFSLCASSVYIINDLCDVESDRKHPIKKFRPIAAGMLSPFVAKITALLLFVIALAVALQVNQEFVLVFLAYFILTFAYSFGLKELAIIDVLILGGLYTLRIIAGIYAIDVDMSFWLLVFSLFIFISLAMLKRFIELKNMEERNEEKMTRRGYEVGDADLISKMGIVSSYIAILVIALYIHDPLVTVKYSTPIWLWLVIPAMLYWLSRIWLIANRGQLHEDPVLFALRDKASYVVVIVCLISVLVAI